MFDDGNPFAITTQQAVEEVLESTELLAASASEESPVIRSQGFDVLLVFGWADQAFQIDILERCISDDDEDTETQPDEVRTAVAVSSIDATTGRQFIAQRFDIHGKFVQIRRTNSSTTTAMTQSRLCAYLLPIGVAGAAGGGGGSGSPDGPGDTIASKADVVIPAATVANILNAPDIPAGTRTVTITNTGANPVRVREKGAGGGASRGQLLQDTGNAMTIGGSDGAIAELEAFSTLGSSVGFLFERD